METTSFKEFFSQDTNISKMRDGFVFVSKADIPKDFNFHYSNHSNVFNASKPSSVNESKVPLIRKVDKQDIKDKEMAAIQTSPFVIPPETFKTLLENLYMARLCFLRARNITINQLRVYEEEAIKHMKKIKRITAEELGNPEPSAELLTQELGNPEASAKLLAQELGSPEPSAELLAQELVKVGSEVIRNQQALNRIEMEELVKNVDSLLNALKSDVKEAKSLAELECKEESKQRSCRYLIFDHGHLCFFIPIALLGLFCVFIIHGFNSLLIRI